MERMDILTVQNISKKLSNNRKKIFFQILNPRAHNKKKLIIKNVSFSLKKGETLGIVGSNASGKTTLLRLISGIYLPDTGKIISRGKITPLINLWISIRKELTMRENIFLTGSLYGLSNKQIKDRYDSIVDFSELKEYESFTLRKFSSGMKAKLVFSIAIHTNPDILILDEAVEVGDEKFKDKVSKYIKQQVKKGMSCIIVSHNIDTIKKNCDRLLHLKDGEIVSSGNTDKIIKEYLESS